MVIQMKYSKFLPVFLPVFLLCHSLIFAGEDYVPEMLEGTQKLREYSTYLRALDRAKRLAIDIKNGNFLKELFGDFGRLELLEEIFRKSDLHVIIPDISPSSISFIIFNPLLSSDSENILL